MIIRKNKNLDKTLSCAVLILCLLISCNAQKEIKFHRIIEGLLVEDFQNYVFSDDPNSVYLTEKDTISVRCISEYDDMGDLIKYSIHKPEGPLEYSIDDLMKDTLLLQSVGGESVKDWKFIGCNKVTNNADTLEVETAKNNLGMNIFIYRTGSKITIFE